MPLPQHYTVAQLAERLAVSPKTIRKLIASGQLGASRIADAIRVSEDAVIAYLQGVEMKSPAPPRAAPGKGRNATGDFRCLRA